MWLLREIGSVVLREEKEKKKNTDYHVTSTAAASRDCVTYHR